MGEQHPVQSAERKGMFEMLTYVWEYQSYVNALRTDSQSLEGRSSDVEREVQDARSNHQDIKQQVLKWLDDGNKELETTQAFLGSLGPLASCWKLACECNCKRRYTLAKRAESHSKEIKKLMERSCFEGGVSLELKPQPPLIPTPLTTTTPSGYISLSSREKYLTRTMEALLEKDKFVIGLYGAKDVGKTMLVKKLVLAIESSGVFNGVSITSGDWVDTQVNYMQVEMGQRVGLTTLTLNSADKAKLLNDKLSMRRKVVIIIDNLEKRIDLKKIGIPWPDNNNDCRIVVVSRSLDVCREMKTQTNLEIELLCQEEALHLFDEIAREFDITDTTLIKAAKDCILTKFLWAPGDIKKIVLLLHDSHKKLSPVRSIVAINGSAKKNLMLGAEALVLFHASKPQYWRWLAPSPSTSSLKVAELIIVWGLSIGVEVREEWLSPATNYGAYLVYQLTPRARGFGDTPMEIRVGNAIKACYLDPSTAVSKALEPIPKRRKDGWLEIELGNFFNVGHSGDVVDLHVKEVRAEKSGLLVQGFELRPLD